MDFVDNQVRTNSGTLCIGLASKYQIPTSFMRHARKKNADERIKRFGIKSERQEFKNFCEEYKEKYETDYQECFASEFQGY